MTPLHNAPATGSRRSTQSDLSNPAPRGSRWTSRKFLLSLAAQATAVAVLLFPQHESAIVETGRSVTALLVLLLTTLGYLGAEASVDRARRGASGEAGGGDFVP